MASKKRKTFTINTRSFLNRDKSKVAHCLLTSTVTLGDPDSHDSYYRKARAETYLNLSDCSRQISIDLSCSSGKNDYNGTPREILKKISIIRKALDNAEKQTRLVMDYEESLKKPEQKKKKRSK